MSLHNWKRISKSDCRAFTLLLCTFAIITLLAIGLLHTSDEDGEIPPVKDSERKAIDSFELSIKRDSTLRAERWAAEREKERNAQTKKWKGKKHTTQRRSDSTWKRFPKTEKLAIGSTIDINTSDTTLLKKIPGIGSYYARKISNYRERLGGFYNVEQIKEVEGLPDSIERWFCIEESCAVRKLNINQASFKELARHPYLTYEQVKIIDKWRRRYGKLSGWDDLILTDEFNTIDRRKLDIYFYFE